MGTRRLLRTRPRGTVHMCRCGKAILRRNFLVLSTNGWEQQCLAADVIFSHLQHANSNFLVLSCSLGRRERTGARGRLS